MKYILRGELKVKIGDCGLLPGACDIHLGAILADESTALLCGQYESPSCFATTRRYPFLAAIESNRWLKCL